LACLEIGTIKRTVTGDLDRVVQQTGRQDLAIRAARLPLA
jgi:hypothetical protein